MEIAFLRSWLGLLFSADVDNIRLAVALASQIARRERDSYLAVAYLQTRTGSIATHADTAEIIGEYFENNGIDIGEYFYFASYTETNTDLCQHWLRLGRVGYEFWEGIDFRSLTGAGLCYLGWVEQAVLAMPSWHEWISAETWRQWAASKISEGKLNIGARLAMPKLPSAVFGDVSIEELQIYGPELESIPMGELYKLNRLVHLSINRSKLERFDLDLRRLPLLRSLAIVGNTKTIKIDIEGREQLEQLDISHNKLSYLPLWVRDLPQLRHFRASGLKFERFPPAVLRMEELKTLELADTKLRDFPTEFGALRNLQKLDLSRGLWERLPSFFVNFEQLERLKLFQCNFKEFPAVLGEMEGLRHLDISGNFIRRLDFGVLGALLSRLEYIGVRDAFATKNLQEEFMEFAAGYPNVLING